MSGPFGSTAWMANPSTGGFYDFPITNSLRFNDDDSAYLNFTPSTAGNRRTFTFSCWVKYTVFDNGASNQPLLSGTTGSTSMISFSQSGNTPHSIFVYNAGSNIETNALFRDPSGWYHIVASCDTTQGTASNRTKLYINGVQVTSLATSSYPAQNADNSINSTGLSYIGRQIGQSRYFDGYMAEVNQIDGLALGPDSFGEFKNDIWIPKDTSGLTFGDQGYRLQFKQTGTGTASSTTIGADTSGNDNHWTSNNLVASDVVPDSPTNNFCTWNPLDFIFNSNNNIANQTFSEGNTMLAMASASNGNTMGFRATMGFSSGKWYYEGRPTDALEGSDGGRFGFTGEDTVTVEDVAGFEMYWHPATGIKTNIGTTHTQRDSTTYADDDILALALDLDANISYWYKNNSLVFTYDFTTHSADGVRVFHPFTYTASSGSPTWRMNWGADSSFAGAETAQGNQDGNNIGDFYYTPRTNHLAMCTANMPDPVEAIDPAQGGSPQDYFNTVLYTGNASTQNITGVGFQPDWVWIKPRSYADNHVLFDSVRGVNQTLYTNTTGGESDRTGNDSLTAFGSDGFSIGDWNNINTNSGTLVSWNWKAGTAFSNDASATSVGSIDSAGSVNTDVGFSIIGYTGVQADATVAHGLGVAPDMIIAKIRSNSGGEGWPVFHRSMGVDEMYLDKTNAQTNGVVWDDVLPTSSVFSVNGNDWANKNGSTMIAYCFASVDGYSKFGKYTGNNSNDGPFVYTGFRPAFVIIKESSAAGNTWVVFDNKRDPENSAEEYLRPNTSDAEADDVAQLDLVSNGFKLRANSSNARQNNGDGATYIYMAFAEQPFKYANAR